MTDNKKDCRDDVGCSTFLGLLPIENRCDKSECDCSVCPVRKVSRKSDDNWMKINRLKEQRERNGR